MATVVIDRLQKLLAALKASCTALNLRDGRTRAWSLYAADLRPGKFDFATVEQLFDRTEAEAAHARALAEPAQHTRQDVALAQVQSDLLSSAHRDYTLRHRTRIRRLAHESVGRVHAASQQGVFDACLSSYLELQILRTGGGDGQP